MIEIHIKAKGENVVDKFNDKECTLLEVSIALFRLKQIEKKLIGKEFKKSFEMRFD